MIVYDSTVNERYARALFNVAKRQGTLDVAKTDAEELLIIKKNSKLSVFLEGTWFATEKKLALIEKLFSGKIEQNVYQLFLLLIKKGRVEYARPILARFIELAEADQGLRHAEVVTAIDLTGDQRAKLQQALEQHTKSRLQLKYQVEPALIGGVRFTMGDLLIDDTVKGKLDKLRYQLQEAARA